MTVAPEKEGASPGSFKVVGTRPVRHDGVDKVTASGQVRRRHQPGRNAARQDTSQSPRPRAQIRSIDTSKAETLPGVRAVLTAKDFPIVEDAVLDYFETRGSIRTVAENVMASDKALYKGHAIAAVAAESPHVAEEALGLIKVDYEVLKPILDVREAMREDAPLLLDNMDHQVPRGAAGPGPRHGRQEQHCRPRPVQARRP